MNTDLTRDSIAHNMAAYMAAQHEATLRFLEVKLAIEWRAGELACMAVELLGDGEPEVSDHQAWWRTRDTAKGENATHGAVKVALTDSELQFTISWEEVDSLETLLTVPYDELFQQDVRSLTEQLLSDGGFIQ